MSNFMLQITNIIEPSLPKEQTSSSDEQNILSDEFAGMLSALSNPVQPTPAKDNTVTSEFMGNGCTYEMSFKPDETKADRQPALSPPIFTLPQSQQTIINYKASLNNSSEPFIKPTNLDSQKLTPPPIKAVPDDGNLQSQKVNLPPLANFTNPVKQEEEEEIPSTTFEIREPKPKPLSPNTVKTDDTKVLTEIRELSPKQQTQNPVVTEEMLEGGSKIDMQVLRDVKPVSQAVKDTETGWEFWGEPIKTDDTKEGTFVKTETTETGETEINNTASEKIVVDNGVFEKADTVVDKSVFEKANDDDLVIDFVRQDSPDKSSFLFNREINSSTFYVTSNEINPDNQKLNLPTLSVISGQIKSNSDSTDSAEQIPPVSNLKQQADVTPDDAYVVGDKVESLSANEVIDEIKTAVTTAGNDIQAERETPKQQSNLDNQKLNLPPLATDSADNNLSAQKLNLPPLADFTRPVKPNKPAMSEIREPKLKPRIPSLPQTDDAVKSETAEADSEILSVNPFQTDEAVEMVQTDEAVESETEINPQTLKDVKNDNPVFEEFKNDSEVVKEAKNDNVVLNENGEDFQFSNAVKNDKPIQSETKVSDKPIQNETKISDEVKSYEVKLNAVKPNKVKSDVKSEVLSDVKSDEVNIAEDFSAEPIKTDDTKEETFVKTETTETTETTQAEQNNAVSDKVKVEKPNADVIPDKVKVEEPNADVVSDKVKVEEPKADVVPDKVKVEEPNVNNASDIDLFADAVRQESPDKSSFLFNREINSSTFYVTSNEINPDNQKLNLPTLSVISGQIKSNSDSTDSAEQIPPVSNLKQQVNVTLNDGSPDKTEIKTGRSIVNEVKQILSEIKRLLSEVKEAAVLNQSDNQVERETPKQQSNLVGQKSNPTPTVTYETLLSTDNNLDNQKLNLPPLAADSADNNLNGQKLNLPPLADFTRPVKPNKPAMSEIRELKPKPQAPNIIKEDVQTQKETKTDNSIWNEIRTEFQNVRETKPEYGVSNETTNNKTILSGIKNNAQFLAEPVKTDDTKETTFVKGETEDVKLNPPVRDEIKTDAPSAVKTDSNRQTDTNTVKVETKAALFSNSPVESVKETLTNDVQVLSNARANSEAKSKTLSFAGNVEVTEKREVKKQSEQSVNSAQHKHTGAEESQKTIKADVSSQNGFNNQSRSLSNAKINKSKVSFADKAEDVFKLENAELNNQARTVEFTHNAAASKLSASTVEANAPQILTQAAAALTAAARDAHESKEVRSLRLHLNPEKLGALEINIKSDEQGRLSAQLTAEKDVARHILHEGMSELRRELENAGFQVERLNVALGQSMTSNGNSQSNAQDFSQKESSFASLTQNNNSNNNTSESDSQGERLLSVLA